PAGNEAKGDDRRGEKVLTRFVVDSSVVMAWCFEDEADKYADSVLDLLVDSEAIVPSIWPLEVVNVLLVAERRQRLTEAGSLQFVKMLRELPITLVHESSGRAFCEILFVGRQLGLSRYDAAYLNCNAEGIALATRDEKLRKASKKCGVKLVEPKSPSKS
ncbi:MAG: type II toxin-antitoxin system VapC family toxin, partial [Syntrophales bacterium LBB04]|nr:type II toxin-antitoxin system VapC family toxin [Syntrophales bacterium LBB04]